MKRLHKYKPTIIFDNDFYTVLGEYKTDRVDKDKLGYLVAWHGGDKVLGYDGRYLICNKIQDAEIEYI